MKNANAAVWAMCAILAFSWAHDGQCRSEKALEHGGMIENVAIYNTQLSSVQVDRIREQWLNGWLTRIQKPQPVMVFR